MAVAPTLNLDSAGPEWIQLIRFLQGLPRSVRRSIVIVGGVATEFWTGGTGYRPKVHDIDILVPVSFAKVAPHDRYTKEGSERFGWAAFNSLKPQRWMSKGEGPISAGFSSFGALFELPGLPFLINPVPTEIAPPHPFDLRSSPWVKVAAGGESCDIRMMSPGHMTMNRVVLREWDHGSELEQQAGRPRAVRELLDTVALLTKTPDAEWHRWGHQGTKAFSEAVAAGVPVWGYLRPLHSLLIEQASRDELREVLAKHYGGAAAIVPMRTLISLQAARRRWNEPGRRRKPK